VFKETGIVTREMFEECLPDKERRSKGPYVIFECFQEIPCNPCQTSCRFGAVLPMADINERPAADREKCTGCGVCVSRCPGLAAFVIDETFSQDRITIKLPYELIPLPAKGEIVDALDREGNAVGEAEVLAVLSGKSVDRTNIITIAVSKDLLYDVRNIRVRR